MLEKNYIINQFDETLSPKFVRQQKYLRKIEHKLFDKSKSKKNRSSKSFKIEDYFKRPQGLKQL